MTKKEKARLRNIVRQCMAELQKKGRYTTAELYERVMERFGEDVLRYAEAMARSSITKIHRDMLRTEHAFADGNTAQLALPMGLSASDIPSSISVPYRTEDGKDELVWTSFEQATFAEFEAHIGMLRAQIANDTRRAKKMAQIHGHLVDHVDDPSETLGGLLERLYGRDSGLAAAE